MGDFNNSIINYCKEGDLYKVSEILNYADEDDEDSLLYITDDKGQTLLHFAVMGGQSEITEYLLTRRANPNAEDNMK